MDRKTIYQTIVDHATLSDAHAKDLFKKRGITKEVAETLKLKSTGAYLLKDPVIAKMPDEILNTLRYKVGDETAVLIPYLEPDNEVFSLRPHRDYFKGSEAHIYIPWNLLGDNTSRLVLAESEFKAVASCMMGVPAISVPGINIFSRKKLPFLIDILKDLSCKELVICFDNEIKDDPKYANYKPDYTKRYDTIIYEYIMAKAVAKYRKDYPIVTKVARLKDSWRQNGKADIDGVLAMGIDKVEYQTLIDLAVSPEDYRRGWEIAPKYKGFVDRRVDRYFYVGPIEEKFNSYYFMEYKNPDVEDLEKAKIKKLKQITNFDIQIVHTAYGTKGAERFCRLKSKYGMSRTTLVKPEVMVSRQAFQKMCYELGDFEFTGTEAHLQDLWHYAMLHQDGRDIKKLKSFGFDSDAKIWFFENGGYYNDKFYPVNEDRIIWVEDDGFMLPKLPDEIIPPTLSEATTSITIQEIYANFLNIVDPHIAKLMLGWALGNFFMDLIVEEVGVYPFLFFYGKAGSGKSTFANFISSFFGLPLKGIPFGKPTTKEGISRISTNFSMIPVWIEEYRNQEPELVSRNQILRNIYDKSTTIKGTKNEDEIKTYKARSTIIISGEELPRDNALQSRCITIPLYKNHGDGNEKSFAWIQNNSSQFNSIGHYILTNRLKLWELIKPRILEYTLAFKNDQVMSAVDFRNTIHHSVLAAVCDGFLGDDKDFSDFIGQQALHRTKILHSNQAINIFLDDIQTMHGLGKFSKPFLKSGNWLTGGNEIAFWFAGPYDEWEQRYARLKADIPASKNALFEHFKQEPYFIGMHYVKIGRLSTRALIFDANHKFCPLAFKEILAAGDQFTTLMPTDDSDLDMNQLEKKLTFGEKL